MQRVASVSDEFLSGEGVLFRVDGSAKVLWKPVALYLVLGMLFSAICNVSTALDDRSFGVEQFVFFLGLWALASGVWTLMTVPWWWFCAARTSCVVTESEVLILRGRKVLRSWPRRSVFMAKIDGSAGWSNFLTPFNIVGGAFPRIRIWTDERFEGPPIMLWGAVTAWNAERQLESAIKSKR